MFPHCRHFGVISCFVVMILSLSIARASTQEETKQITENKSEEGEPLEISEAEKLETVVVTATRTERLLTETPYSTEVISADAISASGAASVAEALAYNTNLYLPRTFGGVGLEMQGLSSEYSLILIDGQKVPGRVGGVIDLSRIPIENVERIEIIRGASSALYGADALAGVVNIITREGQKPLSLKGTLGLGFDKSFLASADVGGRYKNVASKLALGVQTSPGYDLTPGDIATTGSEYEQFNISSRSLVDIGENLELKQRTDYLYRDQRAVEARSSGAVFDRANRTETFSFLLEPKLRLSNLSDLTVTTSYSLFRDQYLLDQRKSSTLDSVQDTWEHLVSGSVQWDTQEWDSHRLSVGLDASYESLRSERLVSGVGTRNRAAVFLQDEWSVPFVASLSVVPGIRLDYDSQFGTQPTPKLGLRYSPWKPVVFRTSYGWGYRAPSFKELLMDFENQSRGYVVAGNLDLNPEVSKSFNFGAEFTLLRFWKAGANFFYNDLENMIATDLVTQGSAGGANKYSYVNVGKALTKGVESFMQLPLWTFGYLKFGYAYTVARDLILDRRLEGRPKHRFNFGLKTRVRKTGTELFVNATRVGERRFFIDENLDGVLDKVDADAFVHLDLNMKQMIFGQYGIYLKAENLLNAGDPDFLPIQPRTIVCGLSGNL